jgi:beta-glucosidase/6-phospho-beta-glucosidase/beta-galactosidase
MGHYEHWREDLTLARNLGLQAIRWGVPWYRVEPHRGQFDWEWVDQVLSYIIDELGITPIIDLMHYGCPFWLQREFANVEYPGAVAEYAAAFAGRYKDLVRWYTPLNEPIVNALMCGKRGLWPPYLRGDGGYLRIMMQLVKGIRNTVTAIKETDPDSIMVHVEATGMSRAARRDLEVLAIEEQRRGYLCYDLLTGRVADDHPLFTWLVRNGASPDDLAALAGDPLALDVIGMNFYPQWSTQEIHVDRRGRVAYRPVEHNGAGFAALIKDYYDRYKVPIIITETSAFGAEDERSRWLKASIEAVRHLRSQGVPVLGYTWFPLFTMIDWRYRFGQRPLEEYKIELGLFKLKNNSSNGRWLSTPLVEQLRGYLADPEKYIGPLANE